MDLVDMNSEPSNELQFLIFEAGGKLIGTPLLQVKEIIEPQAYKPVPATRDYFLGVINLRGKIVGAIDLRQRLSLEARDSQVAALLVFESESGVLAALVDRIVAVEAFEEKDIHRDPGMQTGISTDFLIGIGRFDEQLVLLMDLQHLLDSDEIVESSAA